MSDIRLEVGGKMRICACPICGRLMFNDEHYRNKDRTLMVNCPDHGEHIALATPLEMRVMHMRSPRMVRIDGHVWVEFGNCEMS